MTIIEALVLRYRRSALIQVSSDLDCSQTTNVTDDLRPGPSFVFWKCSWAMLQIVEVYGPINDDLRYNLMMMMI